MFRHPGNRRTRRAVASARQPIEQLEPRMLLSASSTLIPPSVNVLPSAPIGGNNGVIQGYTPAQIRHAYSVDQITFNSRFGTIAGDGTGQTIAIVDAYDDPTIQNDVATFDQQFGLPTAFVTVVNQIGGSRLPLPDGGWAGEISLDVEWAHAIAPGANILLVEADSSSSDDLLIATDYARTYPGVSVVSMSWGGSEFFAWGGAETPSQTVADQHFLTYPGHQGETFIAASGDSGVVAGTNWPGSSPNVLSVGGTNLTLQDPTTGTYGNETTWAGTSAGYSGFETEPSYQWNAQSNGMRGVPDVSWDGDPTTGVAIYDTTPNPLGFTTGWQIIGGTSAGAPQWAGLIAIADQGRALNGLDTLDGATQTLPALYNLYSPPGTPGYSNYTSYFHDVIDNSGLTQWHWSWNTIGYLNSSSSPGYDVATGLGTPIGNRIVQALSTVTSFAITGTPPNIQPPSNGGGTQGSGGTPQASGSPLTATFLNSPRVSVLDGQNQRLNLRITNTSLTPFSSAVAITLYASRSATIQATNIPITTITVPPISLKSGQSKVEHLKFVYPSTITNGTYYLVASVAPTTTKAAPTVAVNSLALTIGPANVDLAAGFELDPVRVTPGKTASALLTIENKGNTTAVGTVGVNLYASTDLALDANDELLTQLSNVRIRVRPGRSHRLRIRFLAPKNLAAGAYNLIASMTPSTQPVDDNPLNNIAIIGTQPK